MFCCKCGKEIPVGMQVCAYCGAPVNANPDGNTANRQGVYGEQEPSYSGQTWNDSGMQYGGYGTPQNMDQGATGLAITSLATGIFSLLLSCILLRFPVLLLLPVTGIVLGILSVEKSQGKKGMAVAGIVCCAVSIAASVIMLVLGFLSLAAFIKYLFRL